MIRFDVSSLIKARLGTSLTLDLDTGPQTLDDLELAFLRGTLQVVRVQGGLLLQGSVVSQLNVECVRCLEPFDHQITLEIEEIVGVPGARPGPDVSYTVSEEGWLDLSPVLREQAWVAIPMKPLCRPDCQGLCPQCGANLNLETCTCEHTQIDPRLAPLKDLL